MSGLPRAKPRPPERPPQPADLLRQWTRLARGIDGNVELDFSFSRDAITMCDMRAPNALRYADLFTRKELADGQPALSEVERRIREFMR